MRGAGKSGYEALGLAENLLGEGKSMFLMMLGRLVDQTPGHGPRKIGRQGI